MSMSKDDYREMGRKVARRLSKNPKLVAGSWQHKAFKEGYDEVHRALVESFAQETGRILKPAPSYTPKPGVLVVRPRGLGKSYLPRILAARTLMETANDHGMAAWPSGAREHFRLLLGGPGLGEPRKPLQTPPGGVQADVAEALRDQADRRGLPAQHPAPPGRPGHCGPGCSEASRCGSISLTPNRTMRPPPPVA